MVVFFLPAVACSADALPTAEDIKAVAEDARLTADTFIQRSFKLRMGYEYRGKFLTEADKESLHKLARSAGDRLAAIAEKQKELKQQIEDYQGDDWDERYGSTGLWRKLSNDLYITNLNKSEIDYYLALTVEQSPLNKTIIGVRERIISLDTAKRSANSRLLMAKILALAKIDSAWQILAIDLIDSLMARPEVPDPIYFRAMIEKIKLTNLGKAEQLKLLADKLAQSSCSDDIELVLSLAFLQRRYTPEVFEKTLQIRPQVEDFLGTFILSDLSHKIAQRQSIEQISVFEAELAAQAAWKNEIKDYQMLLSHLAGIEKFQTPLILYITALAFAESSPTRTIIFLMKASKYQQQQKSDKLEISACKIAEQAAQLAYNLFIQDRRHCWPALEAFENYHTTAGEKIDEELEYLYTIVLNDCGQTSKSKKLLEEIAGRPAGYWRNRAKLDLIGQAIEQEQAGSRQQRSEVFEQLRELILNCRGQDKKSNKLWMEAINVYCQMLLELEEASSAQKILDILAEAEVTDGVNLNLFKARALQQLGRLDESAHYMVLAIRVDSGSLAGVVRELLAEVIDKIDEFETEPAGLYSVEMMGNCKKLATFSYLSLDDRQPGLFLAEISIFAADKDKEKLSAVEKLLNILAGDGRDDDVDFLRCQARLLCEQGEFERAAGLWAQVAEMRKSESPTANRRSWKWWRAKFYELHCFSKLIQTKKEDVLHTIEVLESSFQGAPPLWAEKLSLLKRRCSYENEGL
jgi:hypothetical protein